MTEIATVPASNVTPPAPVTPAAPTVAPAQPRAGFIEDRDYDALPDDKKAGYARVKRAGDQGGAEWIERTKLEAEPADPAKPGTTTTPGDATVTADGRLQVGEMLLSQEDIKTLIAEKAQADLRKTMVPDTPESYLAELPKEFKLPEGIEYKFDTSSPILADARNWAHSQNLTQQQFAQLLAFHASTQIAEQVMVGNAAKAEVEKLGVHGTARVTAVDTWLRGTLGDDLGKHVRGMLLTAKAVEAMEKLATKMSSQGVMAFRQDGREPGGQSGRISQEEYDAMTPGQRYTYSKGFDQKQFSPMKGSSKMDKVLPSRKVESPNVGTYPQTTAPNPSQTNGMNPPKIPPSQQQQE